LSQNFEAGFKMLLETIRAPNFDKEEVTRQSEIQTSEILARKSSDAYSQDLLDQSLFENFPYSLNSNGTEAGVAAITPDSLKAWYDAHVKDRKPVVAVIGDTKGTTLASAFVQHFSGSRFQDTKIPGDFAKEPEKTKSVDQKWNRRESLILVGFQAPPEDDEDGYAVRVLQAYAGDPGRFSQELRDRMGVAYEVSIAYEPRLRGGSLIVSAATNSGGVEDLLKALREQIQQARQGPIPYRDFRSAVNEAVGAYSINQQDRAAQIGGITENVLAGKGIEGYQNCSAGLQDVREEDLKAVVQRLFDLDKAVVVTMRGTTQ